MLRALINFPGTADGTKTVISTPHLYLFDRETNTQVLEDCSDTTDLKTLLVSPGINNTLPEIDPSSIGHSLGCWLRSFHIWTSGPPQAALRAAIRRNEGMQNLKRSITYDSFLGILQTYPQLVDGHMQTLQAIKAMITAEFSLDESAMERDENWGLIHGDFWTGK